MSVFGYLKYQNGQTYSLNKKINIIGRANSCHVVIKHQSSSKEHCLIEFNERNYAFLKDMESLNGTFLNDERLKTGSTVQIFDQDVIQIGQDMNKFTFIEAKQNRNENDQQQMTKISRREYDGDEQQQQINKKDKDFKISVVDYSFKDHSFSKQPLSYQNKRQISPHQPSSPYSINNNNNQIQYSLNQQSEGIIGSTNGIRSQQQLQQNQHQQQQRIEGVKQELYNQNIELNERVLQREEEIIRLENRLKLLQNENDAILEENDKLKAKQKALQLYSSELQKQIDLLNQDNLMKNNQLAELSEQDWTRKLSENNVEIKNLRQVLSQKDNEIQLLKKNINSYFQNSRDVSQNNMSLFQEHQAKELAACKKQIIEYENRDNECQKRWSSLLQENQDKDDKIKGLKLQLSRQIETMQNLYSEHDRKINEYNNKLMRVFEDPQNSQYNENNQNQLQQKEAAEYLVEQVALMQEERRNIAIENENLHTQIQQLISEIDKMKTELDHYAVLFDVSVLDLSSNKANQGNLISKLKNRIDELQDLINEMKQKESVGKLIEFMELFEELEKKLDRERIINDELNKSLKTIQINNSNNNKLDHVNENNSIDFFSQLLDQRDKKITLLLNQIESFAIKERQYNERIEDLSNNLMLTNQNLNEQKSKSNRMTEIMQQQSQNRSFTTNSITPSFPANNNNNTNILTNEKLSQKISSDARIYKAQYNEYQQQ